MKRIKSYVCVRVWVCAHVFVCVCICASMCVYVCYKCLQLRPALVPACPLPQLPVFADVQLGQKLCQHYLVPRKRSHRGSIGQIAAAAVARSCQPRVLWLHLQQEAVRQGKEDVTMKKLPCMHCWGLRL
jgi:hypothetical protein